MKYIFHYHVRYSNCLFYYLHVAPWSIKKLKLYADINNAWSMIYPTNLLFLEKKTYYLISLADIHEKSNYLISLQKFMKKAIKSVLQLQKLSFLSQNTYDINKSEYMFLFFVFFF